MSYAGTSATEVLDHFCTSPGTRSIYGAWEHDPRRYNVVPVVLEHRTRLIYQLSEEDVKRVCQATVHALGNVRRADGERVRSIVDWHPDFAFTHMFHVCMEQIQALPTYQDFRRFTQHDPLGQKMLGSPAREKVSQAERENFSPALARDAMQWRVGNAYYSFLREVHTVVQLRRRGIDLRVHPLADALFRVDAWTGRKALSLRVGNKKFGLGADAGRKHRPEQLLADLSPGFEFRTIELPPASRFGQVHLPSAVDLDAAATLLRT